MSRHTTKLKTLHAESTNKRVQDSAAEFQSTASPFWCIEVKVFVVLRKQSVVETTQTNKHRCRETITNAAAICLIYACVVADLHIARTNKIRTLLCPSYPFQEDLPYRELM